ncbi:MAG: potassium transporter TrkH, partial [Lachnospiraceae bacterium]|nr:potassium transporter TrkH [Lachnospiraceae bacterium]
RIMCHWSEHSKLVLVMTTVLLLAGTVGILAAEYTNPATLGDMSLPKKILNSLFQSVTFRTAGFASVPQESLRETSCVMGCVLMFIGGSPIGTAGGVKTVTAFLVLTNAFHYVRGDKESVVFRRTVSREMMRKAAAVVLISFGALLFMLLLLMGTGNIPLTDAMYEVVSALGTVGLSRALTPTLNVAGRIIIILTMYLGRIGPISLACFFAKENNKNQIRHAEGTFYVG